MHPGTSSDKIDNVNMLTKKTNLAALRHESLRLSNRTTILPAKKNIMYLIMNVKTHSLLRLNLMSFFIGYYSTYNSTMSINVLKDRMDELKANSHKSSYQSRVQYCHQPDS